MRRTFAAWLVVASVGLAAILVREYRKPAAPAAQPVVRSAPPVNTVPDFATGPLPVEDMDADAATPHSARRLTPVQLVPVQPVDTRAEGAAAQRRQDAVLLQR